MWFSKPQKGIKGNQRAYRSKYQPDQKSGEDFRAAVTVGMVFIGWFGGKRQCQQHESGSEDISGRFEPVCENCRGVADEAGGDFVNGKGAAHQHADGSDALPALHGMGD